MTNKGINPLYISALDILLNTLGVFIILNFLNTRLAGTPPVAVERPGKEQKKEPSRPLAEAKPRPAEPRAWWRKPAEPQPVQAQTGNRPSTPGASGKTQPESRNEQPSENQETTSSAPQSLPQDPVAVDLMKQTKGAVVILLQQADQSKQSVEFMLRQGNRSWKPGRASKFQDNGFHYEKALSYFYQTEIEPGAFEVLVRVKKGQKNAGSRPFSLYGKAVSAGQKAQTYNFGTFALNGLAGDWVPAGVFKVSASGLQYQSKLPAATKAETAPEASSPPATTKPVSTPASKPSGKSGKWG